MATATPRNEPLPKLYPVKGTVRCDGAPLANGRIVFEGADDAVLAIVPAFNTKSTIVVEVAPVDADAVDTNTFDFDVKSR